MKNLFKFVVGEHVRARNPRSRKWEDVRITKQLNRGNYNYEVAKYDEDGNKRYIFDVLEKNILKPSNSYSNEGKSWSDHEKEFNRSLNPAGFKIKQVSGDGNCLFRSVQDQLDGYDYDHLSLRKKTFLYMVFIKYIHIFFKFFFRSFIIKLFYLFIYI
jgi:hypothetical protein